MSDMARRLRQVRKSKGYTQESLAHAIGVSRGVISNIEYEKTQPQALVIRAICQALQINEQWLLFGEGAVESSSDVGQRARLLSEIYNSAKELSEAEQDYILDMIRTFQKHKEGLAGGNPGGNLS